MWHLIWRCSSTGFRGISEGLIRIGIWSSEGIDIDGRTRTAKGRDTCTGDVYEF
jgi:hypothetical protein